MGQFTSTANAVRSYVAAMPQMAGVNVEISYEEEVDLSKAPPVVVLVSPRIVVPNTIARNGTAREMTIAVYYSAKVTSDAETASAVDAVEALLDRIESSAWRAVAPAGVAFVSATVELANEESIREIGRYRAVILAVYKVAKGQF